MNYWYVARPNELFLDIDNVSRSIKHAKSRLQGAIECGKLDVAYVVQRPSKSKNHIHVIITLNKMMDDIESAVWEVILHSDIYRGCCNVMRGILRSKSPRILISPHGDFGWNQGEYFADRFPQGSCKCTGKHSAKVMNTCPMAIHLRGEFRNVGFFGKPSKNPCTIWPNL